MKPKSSIDSVSDGDCALLKERYRIFFKDRLTEFDMPNAKAYRTVDEKNPSKSVFTLICDHPLQPRMQFAVVLKALRHSGILNLNEFGTLYWTPKAKTQMCFVYDMPLGGRVMKNLDDVISPIPEKEYISKYAPVLVSALSELTHRGITHRAIRPDNLYYMDKAKTMIVFGDMLTSPPAYDQPVEFEVIESAMSMKEGRGHGKLLDDLYSFGVTSLYISIGRRPKINFRSDEELLDSKIRRGSYSTLVGEEKIPLSMIELLKGLLSDNEEQRWNLDALKMWLAGRRLSPMQTRAGKISQRAYIFNGKEYFTTRELASAYANNWSLAIEAVRSEKLLIWLFRGLEDKKLHDAIESAIGAIMVKYPNIKVQNNVLVAKICLMLDGNACIRYKHLSFLPDGLGSLLANAYALNKQEDINIIIEMLQADILAIYSECRINFTYKNSYKVLASFINHPNIGSGLERCLYNLNEFLPCKSKFLEDEYVNEINKLVPAMDKVAKTVDVKTWPMDRHIAAFISEKFGNKANDQVNALRSENLAIATAGLLSTYAILQWSLGPESVHSLAGWLGCHIMPMIDSYHNKERRKAIENEVPKIIKKGYLPELFNYLDNLEERTKDYNGFMVAKSEYVTLKKEIEQFEMEFNKVNYEAEQLGMQVATVSSFCIALFTIVMLLLLRLM
ncbi:MAG: hypothetical protein BWY78_00518 [Alphaproteobacteria bacterium ADurb.Bin438]|nr:MAG: hypothetical protein BWY78_00518 [Alphaproteobacteria bacterium ADurb.Bin438]